ncbi:MAG: hypothetical protein J5449_08660 [Oscillospiraceae bacterium]|nr:hypothetical protein [Oscillospiraceae bacterium]
MKKSDIAARLREFPYDPGEYWVVAGGAMVLHGLREDTADIDLGCTPRMADELEARGYLYKVTPDGNRWFKLDGGMEVFENWLCDTVVHVGETPVVSPRGLLEMKRLLGREKDKRDAERIEEYLRRSV